MADSSSTLPEALQDFIRHCAQPTFHVDYTKYTTRKIVKQALSDILEPIKPGRFLLESRPISKNDKVETVEQDEEEQTSEVEEEGDFDPALQRQIRDRQERGKEEEEDDDDDDGDSDHGGYGEAYGEVHH